MFNGSPSNSFVAHCLEQVRRHPLRPLHFGKVQSVVGLLIEASELPAAVGELCYIHEGQEPGARRIKAEVVGLRGNTTILMPLEETRGLRAGYLVEPSALPLTIRVGEAMLGRVVDANARPIDGKGPLTVTDEQPVRNDPPPPLSRRSSPCSSSACAIHLCWLALPSWWLCLCRCSWDCWIRARKRSAGRWASPFIWAISCSQRCCSSRWRRWFCRIIVFGGSEPWKPFWSD